MVCKSKMFMSNYTKFILDITTVLTMKRPIMNVTVYLNSMRYSDLIM